MVPGYQNFEGDGVGISDLKRVTPEKVDSSDKEVEKKAHSKKDEEIEKITQLWINLDWHDERNETEKLYKHPWKLICPE